MAKPTSRSAPTPKPAPDNGPLAATPVLRVLLIRHGEKPVVEDNLSCAGLNRSWALPTVRNKLLPLPLDFTCVPLIGTDSREMNTSRMFQTATPDAVRHNLIINGDYEAADTAGLTEDLRGKRDTVLVVWEHHHIFGITAKLRLKKQLLRPECDFDGMWQLDFAKESNKGKAKHPILTRHKQGIILSPTCALQ